MKENYAFKSQEMSHRPTKGTAMTITIHTMTYKWATNHRRLRVEITYFNYTIKTDF